MKSFIVILLILFSFKTLATTGFQLGTGGLTPHFVSQKKNYCNQWNNTGIIANKSYYLRLMAGDWAFTYLTGNDSICSEIEGIFLHYTLSQSEIIDMSVTFGGYAYNEDNWVIHAEGTPSDIAAPEPVSADYFGRAIVPVLALEVGVHLIRRERWSVKLNNILTPFITNHSLAYEYRF